MIIFDCPLCGEEMQVSDKKAGYYIQCVECGEHVEVRERSPDGKKPKRRKRRDMRRPDYLEGWEYAMYGAIFALSPCLNAIVAGVIYSFWNEKYPNRAYSLNQLSWLIIGVQVVLIVLGVCGCFACNLPARRP